MLCGFVTVLAVIATAHGAAAQAWPGWTGIGRGLGELDFPSGPRGSLFPDAFMKFSYVDQGGIPWNFDFSNLDVSKDLSINDADNHTYLINPRGAVQAECLPSWAITYTNASILQVFGEAPACNLTTNYCIGADGARHCCTRPCEALAVGRPRFTVLDPSNPLFGGIVFNFTAVPPSTNDPFMCPWNPKNGIEASRGASLIVECDASMDEQTLDLISVTSLSPCFYEITAKAKAACGCSPDCRDKNCGPDGCGGFCSQPGPKDSCPTDYSCVNGVCCKPFCAGMNCGTDSCGGSCGTCTSTEFCDASQRCQPKPVL